MEIDRIIDGMTPEVYQRLATAVELGKWPNRKRTACSW